MKEKVRQVLMELGYKVYSEEREDEANSTYSIKVLHSIKSGGSSRWFRLSDKIENQLTKALTKAGIKIKRISVNEDRYKDGLTCAKYLADDSEARIRAKAYSGYVSEMTAYIVVEA